MKLATALWATLAVLLAATVRAQCPASFSALAPSVLPLGGGVELSFVVSPPAQAALVTAVFVAGAACSSLQTNATDGRVSCIAPDGSSSSDRYVPVNVNEAAPGSGSCNSTGLEVSARPLFTHLPRASPRVGGPHAARAHRRFTPRCAPLRASTRAPSRTAA
jgi:hypothetical protein